MIQSEFSESEYEFAKRMYGGSLAHADDIPAEVKAVAILYKWRSAENVSIHLGRGKSKKAVQETRNMLDRLVSEGKLVCSGYYIRSDVGLGCRSCRNADFCAKHGGKVNGGSRCYWPDQYEEGPA